MKVGPRYKICKRLGSSVFEKCQTQKFVLSESRRNAVRRTTGRRPRAASDYGKQLLEKQRVRLTYGLTEKQLVRYVRSAGSLKGGNASTVLLQALETRLDNVVFRLGLAPTRRAARQMVSHGHIRVNTKRATIPSYHIQEGDNISIREGSRDGVLFSELGEYLKEHSMPAWLSFDENKLEGSIKNLPTEETVATQLDLTVILEFYSR
ncbi:30S ribosomal protein S4 [Patescibacteria group bacterium]|nr:30S ribosomal protein S4 [Patescibacteria group bacterium]